MAGDKTQRKTARQHDTQTGQAPILRDCERMLAVALQFHADRKIVAPVAPLKARYPGMPRARMRIDKLQQLTATPDQKMR